MLTGKDKISTMKIIGITGGVGAGKTQVLSYIAAHWPCRIIKADEAAHFLYQPGQACFEKIVDLLGSKILNNEGTIDRSKMAAAIFGNSILLEKVNQIVHPEVKKYIIEQIEQERQKKVVTYFFIEAALLIEEQYDRIVDELWYIYADEDVRRKRLTQSRHYSEDKIAAIMKKQRSEEEFRKSCQVVIMNNEDLEETYRQIDRFLEL